MPRIKTAAGFTLVELLVVLVMIGIILSVATLSISTGDISAQMDVEMRRIYALINLAREEAIIQGQEMALAVEPHEYGFETYETTDWQPMDQDKMFRTRTLQVGMQLSLVADKSPLDLSNLNNAEADKKPAKPEPARVYILSSGEISPFELILRSSDESVQFRIRAGDDGKLELITPADQG
ncbi:MAG: type II secretion system minor pseudopilin GspH [Gammaproteobacteria bacterium]|nr:type II secretion system minor pseudopilin GspH [Gammaproteobacteria bacterium]